MKAGDLVIYRYRSGGKSIPRYTRTTGIILDEVSGITDPSCSEYRWFNILIPGVGVKLACDHYLEPVP